ncbi:MAG TPA: SGNH/GDSL hydrolase family protein [Polyangiaceae bacterium]|nr:SGNH/GDSL hydrolase family protein [Polyangiaceae bacterium]
MHKVLFVASLGFSLIACSGGNRGGAVSGSGGDALGAAGSMGGATIGSGGMTTPETGPGGSTLGGASTSISGGGAAAGGAAAGGITAGGSGGTIAPGGRTNGGSGGGSAGLGGKTAGGTGSGAAGSPGNGGKSSSGGSASGGTTNGGNSSSGGLTGNSGPCTIWPIGDSITVGHGSDASGFRTGIFAKTVQDNLSVSFIGTESDGPDMFAGRPFPKRHDGYVGYRTDQVLALIQDIASAVKNTPPGVVLILLGTNDAIQGATMADSARDIGKVIDAVFGAFPDAAVALAQITPTNQSDVNMRAEDLNARLPALVESRSAAGKRITLVDMYAAFTREPAYANKYLKDGIHPNDTGYAVMTEAWYAAIGPALQGCSR